MAAPAGLRERSPRPRPRAAGDNGPALELRRWAPVAAGAAALLAAGLAAALLLTGGGSDDRGGAAATAPASAAGPGGAETPGTTTKPSAAPPSPGADRIAVVGVLRGYEAAYAEASLADMSKLLTPDVERHGLSAGGCSTVFGKSSVLSAYESQFAENGPVPYRLVGLSPADVYLYGNGEARIDTEYSISSTGNSGAISFALEEGGDGWSISEIDATCNPSSS